MDRIRFQPEPANGFYNTLKCRVNAHFEQQALPRYATAGAVGKAILFAGLFAASYATLLLVAMPLGPFLLLWFAMGVFIILAAMSIVHDAAHGVFSARPWVNMVLLRFANLVGGDGYMYKYKHTVSHHAYTNIQGLDIDLEQSTMVRVTPFTASRSEHQYQHRYMRVLYPFYILFWVLFRDFKYYQREKIGPVTAHHPVVQWVTLFATKAFYFFYMLVVPALVLPVAFWQIAAGFVCMHLGSGVVAMFALLANHAVEDSVFVVPDPDGRIHCSWGEHQLRTTDDYSPDSQIISFLFSGLNHHVAHHLFPRYCHVHYPAITKIVRATAEEFGLRYRYNSLFGALSSHFRLLKKMSTARR
ncbi:fatty acid desaturase family protein [Hymenobacter sp. BT491]|uniref:fatty acid desaturase family protein n=1 Tax=Hymenobacter sp. BT491 TaxID=2766779 RepID=UPI001653AF98|nr:acyl-CoA desaturase [Hymenobacter sp. BT491]MBC6990006.1 acyl-CoA desaturase [Hymenobacter sp. BT491]